MMTTPKERPILFSGPMVRAILAGRKSQTRRVMKPQPTRDRGFYRWAGAAWDDRMTHVPVMPGHSMSNRCPYGAPGDRLWVKETWRTAKSLDAKSPSTIASMCLDAGYQRPWAPLAYDADGSRNDHWHNFEFDGDAEPGKTRVSIHMPRWASRLLLEVVSVRVERLQVISEADAIAEGVSPNWIGDLHGWDPEEHGYLDYSVPLDSENEPCYEARESFRTLWQSINGPELWQANPWVWVVEFKRAELEARQ